MYDQVPVCDNMLSTVIFRIVRETRLPMLKRQVHGEEKKKRKEKI